MRNLAVAHYDAAQTSLTQWFRPADVRSSVQLDITDDFYDDSPSVIGDWVSNSPTNESRSQPNNDALRAADYASAARPSIQLDMDDDFYDDSPAIIGDWDSVEATDDTRPRANYGIHLDASCDAAVRPSMQLAMNDDFYDDSPAVIGEWSSDITMHGTDAFGTSAQVVHIAQPASQDDFYNDSADIIGHWSLPLVQDDVCAPSGHEMLPAFTNGDGKNIPDQPMNLHTA